MISMEQGKKTYRPKRHADGLLRQAARYALVAAAGFAADYGMLILLKEVFGLHYLLAAAIAFIIGVAVNYVAGALFVFRKSALPRAVELTGFLFVSLAALGLTELMMYVLTDLFKLHYMVSRVLSGAATYLFNFFMRRCVLYRGTDTKSRNSPAGSSEE